MTPRLVAVVVSLALLSAACAKGGRVGERSSTATTTTTTSTTEPTTTTPAPSTVTAVSTPAGGCDPQQLTRVAPRRDRTSYEVVAALDAGGQVTGTLKAAFTPDRATDRLVLRLWPNGPVPSAKGAREDIGNVTVNGSPVGITSLNPTTVIVNTGEIAGGKSLDLALSFVLRLPGPSDDRLSRSGTTVRLGSWLPLLAWEPGAGWVMDPPTTSNAEASTSIAADFDVRLATPPGLTVLASGDDLGEGRWKAMAVPDWAASIGDFTVVTGTAVGVEVVVGVDTALSESPTTYLNRVTSSLVELARRYGDYPWSSFTLAITPNLKGGIEYPGHVMQGPNTNARTTPHEVAHQWFYGLVGNDQGRDPWLDEGLATWAEAQINGTYGEFRDKSVPANGKGHLGEPMEFWDKRRGSYYRSVYVQGLQALASLGVSTAAVDCALARYVATNAYRVATPATLAAALRTVAPNAEDVLERFGAQRVRPTT